MGKIEGLTRRSKIPFHNDWCSTGFLSVDMVASAVTHARMNGHGIKAIYLKPSLYTNFLGWVEVNLGEQKFAESIEAGFQFDGINIHQGSVLQSKELVMEFYENQIIN